MAIVTVSHEMGAGGSEIGHAVAERLGYRYVDQELISEAARRYGVLEEKLNERDETRPSLFERFDTETRLFTTVIQTSLYDFAEDDNVILMGRGGQVLLGGVAHALRVRVMAPFELRVKRVMKKMAAQIGEALDQRTATEMVRRSDAEKAGRVRYVYEVDGADPRLYDLVINTEKLTVSAVTELLVGLVKRPELASTETSRQLVADRALASRVRTGLAMDPETRRHRIEVKAEQGVVTLEGSTALDAAVAVARSVRGVVNVKTEIVEIPPIPPFVA